MSESTLEQRPRAASGTEAGTQEKALTPAERAEREIVKMDEEMDAILGTNSNRGALVNAPNQALQPPEGRSITPGVAPPIAASSFNHLVLNCVIPGSGTLLQGKTGKGLVQLGLFLGALPVLLLSWKILLAVLMVVVAYGWSIATGIGFLDTTAGVGKRWK
jgi:TM2 domain-containing membrane protein YozV